MDIAGALDYAERLLEASLGIVGRADGIIVNKTARDPEVVGLTILCRSISNFRSSMRLVQDQGVVEARALVRLMYENVLWIGALQEQGAGFVAEMLNDEAHNRKTLAQFTFYMSAKNGGLQQDEDTVHLRTLVSEMEQQFPIKKKLNAKTVAKGGPLELAYFEYGQFSLDAVHCSITALGRHISRIVVNGHDEYTISVVPLTLPREVLSTIVSACRALIFAIAGVNGLVKLEQEGDGVAELMAEFEAANWDLDQV